MYEGAKSALLEVLHNLDKAYANFFCGDVHKENGDLNGLLGIPKFKSRYRIHRSFRFTGRIRLYEMAVGLSRLRKLLLNESCHLPFESVFFRHQ